MNQPRETLLDAYERLIHQGEVRPDSGQRTVLAELERIRTELEAAAHQRKGWFAKLLGSTVPAPKGLYLWGGVGRGKSMLMDLFHGHTAIERKRRVHFHAFMQDVQARIHAVRKTGVDDAIRPVAEEIASEVRLLCFDEMQIGDIADAMIVGRLFQFLFDLGVTVVTTSNRPPDELYKDGLNRGIFLPFIELLKQRLTVRELDGATDYRLHRLAGAQVWFSPAGASARRAIDRIWQDLTGEGKGSPLRLNVNGRVVELTEHNAGVIRTDFWTLCGRPLGAADYLAVATATHVLIMEDIPCLSASNYNEAKRFVTLIDALYEARVRLICSAADVPERLYVEGTGAFEFERTASRLREMQGADWAL